jgi:hypothetical protein
MDTNATLLMGEVINETDKTKDIGMLLIGFLKALIAEQITDTRNTQSLEGK